MPKKIMLQCATVVNRDAVRRETIDGVEHIIVSSFTLPDNVVMNGGLYPAEEIEKSFSSLERTLAPVEHPIDNDGNFLSASDPIAIHNFHAGAFNVNVTRKDGRVHIEKFINVQQALKSEKGKRLLDRINELETNNSPRPIHTSTGVFLVPNILEVPVTNEAGQEYTWIASEMVFDHDAILLDTVAAAQPSQGVGMAVNADGEACEINKFIVNAEPGDLSHDDIRQSINEALNRMIQHDVWIQDVFEDMVIYDNNDVLFQVPYVIDENEIVTIVGIPLTVEREITYIPKANNMLTINGALADRLNREIDRKSSDDDEKSSLIDRMASAGGIERDTLLKILSGDIETPPDNRLRGFARVLSISFESLKNLVSNNQKGDAMKEAIVAALNAADIDTTSMDDTALLAEYDRLQANQSESEGEEGKSNKDGGGSVAEIVANALTPIAEKLARLETKLNVNADNERDQLAEIVGNSDKYAGLTVKAAKGLKLEDLKIMAANCGTAHGIPLTNDAGTDDTYAAPVEMPE